MDSRPSGIAHPSRSRAPPQTFGIVLGHASDATDGRRNEDFFGAVIPTDSASLAKGVVAAIADGMSGTSGGRVAAECVVRSLLMDYYAASDGIDVHRALDRVIRASNQWLVSQGRMHTAYEGMASTLSALVLCGDRYHVAHVGDTRIYLWRDEWLTQLTVDHVWTRRTMHNVVKRAMGLDDHVFMQYATDELHAGDLFLLVSDGVWEMLGEASLREALARRDDPQRTVEILIDKAMTRGGQCFGTIDATAAAMKVVAR